MDGHGQRQGIVEGRLCGYIVRFMPKDDGEFAEVQVQRQPLQPSCRPLCENQNLSLRALICAVWA